MKARGSVTIANPPTKADLKSAIDSNVGIVRQSTNGKKRKTGAKGVASNGMSVEERNIISQMNPDDIADLERQQAE